jgi:hypothetical protein
MRTHYEVTVRYRKGGSEEISTLDASQFVGTLGVGAMDTAGLWRHVLTHLGVEPIDVLEYGPVVEREPQITRQSAKGT